MDTIKTQRLILRPFNKGDLTDLNEYASLPEVGPNAGWRPHASLEETARILLIFIEKGEDWAIEEKKSGKVVGSISLNNDVRRHEMKAKTVGYVLSPHYWGQGYMTEAVKAVVQYAFEVANVEVLAVNHYPFNVRSKRVIEKCGFHYEGTLRHAKRMYDGSIYDELCYSILREEYFYNNR